jgi:hypothetical protein
VTASQTFATVAEGIAHARSHGLRGISCAVYSEPTPEAPGYVISVTVRAGDTTIYTCHGTGPTIERAENAAIARGLLLAFGIVIGSGGTSP